MRSHSVCLAAGIALFNSSCDPDSNPQQWTERGALSASLSISLPDHGLSGVRFLVLAAGDDCTGSVLSSQTVSLAGANAGDESHTFADALFVLAEGSYTVCALPLSGDAPSSECALSHGTIDVSASVTQELTLVSQCIGPNAGGLGTLLELNDPPRIEAVTIDPAKYITVCESLAIDVSVDDPNHDEVLVSFSISEGPAGSHLTQEEHHAHFFGPAGDYTIRVVAEDSHQAQSSLTFPVHVAEAACAVPAEVQAIFEARCAPCHITGASGGLKLTPDVGSYAALVGRPSGAAACATRTLVLPGDAANSYLIAKLRGAPAICGGPMPRGRPLLPEEEIATVEAWINALPH